MNIIKINKIPEWAVYYMYYGEDDNLTEEDIVEIEEFMDEKGLLQLIDVVEEKYFSSHPAFGSECMVYDCWFEAKEGVVGDEDLEDDEILNEGFRKKPLNERNNDNYTHFAVHKKLGKILNGWDYSDYDPEDLRSDKRYYFWDDLEDMELNPKDYKILTYKTLMRSGIDPDDDSNWLDIPDVNALNEGFKGFKKKALNTVLIFSLGMNAAFVLSNLGKNEKEEIVDTVKTPIEETIAEETNQLPDKVYMNTKEELCFRYENLSVKEAADLFSKIDDDNDFFSFVKENCSQKTMNKLARSFALQLGLNSEEAKKAMKQMKIEVKEENI